MVFIIQAKSVYCTVKSKSKAQGKGKCHPITCHEGTDCKYRYGSTLYLNSALNGDRWLTPDLSRFTPGNKLVPSLQEAGWAGPLCTGV